ncbi:MAG: MarR family transcriptional regulator, partial [Spirosoma sp.]|nr:MarR family transcriptional regulator [Spirosoma sp.]
VARIIDLLERKNFLVQTTNQQDRRRVDRAITSQGQVLLLAVTPIVLHNRSTALHGLSVAAIDQLRQTLEVIISNCEAPA